MSYHNQLLIRSCSILLPNGEFLFGYVQIQNGKITQVAPEITDTNPDGIIDATGLTLLPGVIDPQVHFR